MFHVPAHKSSSAAQLPHLPKAPVPSSVLHVPAHKSSSAAQIRIAL